MHTGETLLICGVTGEVVSVPLVQVTLNSSLCSGTYLCGLVATLPTGIALLVGNDLCNEPGVAQVNVVTSSMAAAMATKATEVTNTPEVKPREEVGVSIPLMKLPLLRMCYRTCNPCSMSSLPLLKAYPGSGKSAHYSRHPKCSQNCLISVELVLLYMFHTIFLMGN